MNIGRYEVIRKLATGGMAEVFLAKVAGPFGFEKTLVVKRILPHLADEPAFVEMFLAEAKLVAQLNHPHIVQIFDFGEAEGAYFVAMEYIDGPNLRTLLKHARTRQPHLRPTLCAKMIAAACEGLAYAHDFHDPVTRRPLNLIHRDISPDNILLSRQGALKVADFGIAKATGHGPMTQEGVLKGKLPYMSPEHLRGKRLDRRADVYALGLVLYELLTCRKPFDVTTEAGLLRAIIEDPFIPAEERRPDLPEHLQQILDRALAKDRDERYPDCLSFQADLERFAASEGETLGSLHIARLITHLEADTAQPLPTPPPSFPTTRDFRSMEDPLTLPRDPTVSSRPHARAPGSLPQSTGVLDEATSFEQKMRSRGRIQVAASILAVLLFAGGGGYLLSHGRGAVPPRPATASDAGPDLADAGIAHAEAKHEPAPTQPLAPPVLQDAADAGAAATPPVLILDAGPAPFSPPKPAAPRPKSPLLTQQPTGKTVAGTGFVEFRVVPYATVLLDGQELGTTPFDRVEVSAGRHTVRLVNQTFPKTETRTIYVRPGEQVVVKHNFETQ
ncbi:serine/threonine-protein kinase [Hyalangium minutum]|uniref:Protein kinase domain-containing protein n=1 Tax=Hyalangium minutum TaxID=394096 RepID=A0A085W3E6_9BACT|nr:serine/threonine-protein kinase [Hyalangium minutum]KFE62209.1 hypothetical protein DB31_4315 [Hyalangium minutum]